jgi:hypothetical protein
MISPRLSGQGKLMCSVTPLVKEAAVSSSKSQSPRCPSRFHPVLLALPAWFLTGCLSLTGMEKSSIAIETEPAGALATSISGEQCTTPCSIKVRKIQGQLIRIERDGFEPAEFQVESRGTPGGVARLIGSNAIATVVVASTVSSLFPVNSIIDVLLYLGGISFGASTAMTVDLWAGAHRTLTSNSLRITLEPLPEPGEGEAALSDPADHPRHQEVILPSRTGFF